MRKWVIFVCTLIIFNAFAKDGELSLDEKREIYRNELLDEKAQDDLSNTLNDHKLWLKKQVIIVNIRAYMTAFLKAMAMTI